MENGNSVEISTDRGRIDMDYCYDFIARSYWAMNRSRAEFEKSLEKSLCVGAFCDGCQVGFARVVTDHISIAYVADVFVDDAYRRRGIALMLITALHDHPDMRRVKRWMLATRDMQPVYRRLGYVEIDDMMMMRLNPGAIDHPALK
ncbi:GNAT family N-acetyltransferase [Thalassospira mesophila]|uniref:GCN5 family acetyltransferase n=1 Tax=Thalassospira mesophila TaxID=1293891 RepID=A0A1Y2KZC2_9PROT|nr:GNAT family N-acetyltransferase [Thalassospira mesophila]OSQ37041.1 GCN5 family acetyltransferase [Thalassospira mesophila]